MVFTPELAPAGGRHWMVPLFSVRSFVMITETFGIGELQASLTTIWICWPAVLPTCPETSSPVRGGEADPVIGGFGLLPPCVNEASPWVSVNVAEPVPEVAVMVL